jgi:hypothetical protein
MGGEARAKKMRQEALCACDACDVRDDERRSSAWYTRIALSHVMLPFTLAQAGAPRRALGGAPTSPRSTR